MEKSTKDELIAAVRDVLAAQETTAGSTVVVPGPTPMTRQQAVTVMKSAAAKAEQQGDVVKARELRREVAVWKMQDAERARERHPSPSRMGPGTVELFDRIGHLGEDSELGGI